MLEREEDAREAEVLDVELDPLEVLALAEPRIRERMFWRGRRLETTFCFFMVQF